MASGVSESSLARLRRRRSGDGTSLRWVPTWSSSAARRALSAAIVMPGLFAVADVALGNLQVALFAAFGSFATLVMVSFSGHRREKLAAHLALAVAGSLLLTIGTAVNSSTALAAAVTLPVAFAVFFAGLAGPNAASWVSGALLAYVLPAATPGTIAMIPDRLAGWWLASVVGSAAVLVVATPSPGEKLGKAASRLGAALADALEAALRGEATESLVRGCIDAKHELLARFTATPFRPTGLGLADEALAEAVELLEWCTSLLVDTLRGRSDPSHAAPAERELLAAAAAVLRESGLLFAGRGTKPDLALLEERRAESIAWLRHLDPDGEDFRAQAQLAFHLHAIGASALVIGGDALLASRMETADQVADARLHWFCGHPLGAVRERRLGALYRFGGAAARHASVRSVWFINSLRGALALAAAVAVADLTNVQHGFWVVLGTLSVLRTSAASTGATALRAILGTAVGFGIGAALLAAIGSTSTALWVALPIAVLVAAYAPGVAPFVVGQAAFTVTVTVLFNLLVPTGWKVGELRIEDVAIGCAVSVLVGTLFWPRGVAAVVGDDLADAYRSGASHLKQAVEWVCGLRSSEPTGATRSVAAQLRLNEALRAFLAERGTKHISREELWRLVGGTLRLRLTALAAARLPPDRRRSTAEARAAIGRRAETLHHFYEQLAEQVGRPHGREVRTLGAPAPDGGGGEAGAGDIDGGSSQSRQTVWLDEQLEQLIEHLGELVRPAARVALIRREPWWR